MLGLSASGTRSGRQALHQGGGRRNHRFRQDHKEGRRFHFVGVNFRLHRFQAHRAFFDRFISNYPLCFFGIGTHFSDDWRNIFLILGGKLPRKSATNKLQSFMPACVPLTLWYNMIELRAAALIAHRLWQ